CRALRGRRVAPAELPRPLGPLVRFRTGDGAHEVAPAEPGRGLALRHQARGGEVDAREHGLLRPVVAEVAHERTRVEALDPRDALPREVVAEALLGAP